jgi:hypothetical protein
MAAPIDNRRLPKLSKTLRNERAAKALTMRNAGASFEKIAETLQISEQQAHNDVTRAIKEWVKIPAEQMLDRQRAILNDLIRVEYPAAMNPQHPRHYEASRMIVDVLKHEANLYGLHAPTRVNLGISEQDFAKQAVELLKATGPGPLRELAGLAPLDAEVVEDDEPWSNL